MKKTVVLFLFAMSAFMACTHSTGVVLASTNPYPDPACPNGYVWVTDQQNSGHGACLREGMPFAGNCVSYRDNTLTPAYMFWACGGDDDILTKLASNPF
jgi:hypothetical protein